MAEMAENKQEESIGDKIRLRFERSYNLLLAQRDASNEDIRFCDVDGGMWEDFFPTQFANRPRLEFNKVNESVYRTYAEWMDNRFRVKYLPDSMDATEDDAKILNGLYRRDENNSNGFDAYDVAFNEMLKGGVGAWRLRTQYVNEENPDNNEQEVVFEPIFNAYNAVCWDDNAKKYDKSDAEWVVVLHEFTKEAYEAKYPDKVVESFGFNDYYNRTQFNWTTKNRVFVAEYFEKITKDDKVFVYRDPFGNEKNLWKSEIKDHIESLAENGFEKLKEYRKKRIEIQRTVVSAGQILEETKRIAGRHLPIVPVYGFRSYVDGQEFYYGKVRKLKDPNRLYNMAISRFAEDASTSTKAVPILYQDEVQGLESYWTQSHLAKYAYLVKKPHINNEGQEVERQIQYLQPPPVDPNNVAIADVSAGFIDQKAGNNPGDVLDSEASGVSIREQAMRMEQPDSILFENMAKSMRRCGVIYRSIASEIYDGERFVMLLEDSGINKPVTLMQWSIGSNGLPLYLNDITKGEYKVSVDTGPAFASRRRETVQILKELLQFAPQGSQEIPVLMNALLTNIDGEGLDDVRSWARKNMMIQGIVQPETEEEVMMMQQIQAQREGQQDPSMLVAQGAFLEGQAAMQDKINDQQKLQIDAFRAQTDRQKVEVDAAEAGVNIQNTQADTQGKMLDNMEKGQQLASNSLPRLLQGL